MKLVTLLLVFSACLFSASSTRYVEEQVAVYRTLLDTDRLTLDGFRTLISLHDGWVCKGPCEVHMKNILGEDGISWDELIDYIVDKLYDGEISEDPFQPQEVHLSLTGNVSEMKVMWVTGEQLMDPFVEFVLSTDDWSNSVKSSASSYTYTVPQYWWPVFEGLIYEVNMDNLVPSTEYKYRVGGYDTANSTTRLSKEFSYHAAPVTNAPDQKVTIATLADQGTFMLLGFATTELVTNVQDTLGVDVVMFAGDVCYAGLSSDFPRHNITSDDEFEHVWDLWGIQSEPVAATRPFMVGVGNHEKFYNFTSFNARYKMPSGASGGSENFWYSYNYGNVHWISLSGEHSLDEGGSQMTFLRQDLEAATANRANVPWIIVSLHRPLYCSSRNSYSQTSPGGKYQAALEPILLEFDVDMTLTGHMHLYERIHPNVNGSVTVLPVPYVNDGGQTVDMYYSTGNGPLHVVQGNTGAMQDELWVHPKPAWSSVRFANGFIPSDDHPGPEDDDLVSGVFLDSNYSDTFGIGVVTFANSTHLHYSCIPITGDIGKDDFWIVRRM